MAYRQRTGVAATTQSILTDDPDFLRLIVERVIQEVLEAEMTAHLRAEPYERNTERKGYPQWVQAPPTQHAGWHAHLAGAAGSGRDVLNPALRSLPA
jgi:hypothetical protein